MAVGFGSGRLGWSHRISAMKDHSPKMMCSNIMVINGYVYGYNYIMAFIMAITRAIAMVII